MEPMISLVLAMAGTIRELIIVRLQDDICEIAQMGRLLASRRDSNADLRRGSWLQISREC